MALTCGVLLATSAANSGGTDLRPGRYTDLAGLVTEENREYEALQQRVADLTGDVDQLTSRVGNGEVRQAAAAGRGASRTRPGWRPAPARA